MISEDVVVKSIKQSLEMLRNRIKTLMPTTLCHIGETVVHDVRQIHASFLKTPQDETLDLCILLRLAGTQFIITGDVVKGGSGEVLSELGPIVSSEREEETEPFGQHIYRSILEQEGTLIQALR
jgi:hypothetical protein